MHRCVTILLASVLGLIASAPVFSQRLNSAAYDSARQVKLQGVVTRIDWVNPHAFAFIDVRDGFGIVANWAVEIGEPFNLEKNGWKRNTLRIGDMITVEGSPARAGSRQAIARTVVMTNSNKRVFTASEARSRTTPSASAPRWPDGRVRLGPPEGKKGYWGTANAKSLVESAAAAVPMNDDGLLVNLADADKVAPFLPWSKALFEYRQRTLLKDDPYGRCLPPGGPRQFLMPNGFQFIEQRELGRILVLLGGGDRNWRVIYTDGRPQGTTDELVLTYYGNSVGRWEGDALVVDSIGFNEKFWLSPSGLPHTEALHLVEKFTRTDMNTLRYEVTVEDPRTYSRTWTGGWTMSWVPDQEIQEYFCEENAESTFVR